MSARIEGKGVIGKTRILPQHLGDGFEAENFAQVFCGAEYAGKDGDLNREVEKMQALWKGTLQIARLQIPIKLYAAAEEKTVSLRQRHKECNHPVRYVKYCAHCGSTVPPDRLASVYEWGGGGTVEVEEDELRRIAPAQDKRFHIRHFVPSAEVSPLFMKKHYYVGKDEAGEEALALVHQGLSKRERMGIGYITLRSAQQLAVIRAAEERLMLTTLHYADEVRSSGGLDSFHPEGRTQHLQEEFGALMERLSISFEPGQYPNLYNEALKKLVTSKISRLEPKAPSPVFEFADEEEGTEDLLAAIQQSLKDTSHL